MPAAAEESAVARDIALARMTGANLHLTHLSTAGSIELVRRAKADGVPVTCDVTPHHLAMTDEWVAGSRALAWEVEDEALLAVPYDSSTKVNPPLRGRADVRALWAGLVDGTVDAIATDHAPHASVKKDVEFDQAAFGISGLETALALVLPYNLADPLAAMTASHKSYRADYAVVGSGCGVGRAGRRARVEGKEHSAHRTNAHRAGGRDGRRWGTPL